MYGSAMKLTCILSLRTDKLGQTVQVLIRVPLEEQSDQGLHCFLFCRHLFEALLNMVEFLCLHFRVTTANGPKNLESYYISSSYQEKSRTSCGQ